MSNDTPIEPFAPVQKAEPVKMNSLSNGNPPINFQKLFLSRLVQGVGTLLLTLSVLPVADIQQLFPEKKWIGPTLMLLGKLMEAWQTAKNSAQQAKGPGAEKV